MTFVFVLAVIIKFGFSVLKYGLPLSYSFSGNPYSMCMYFTCLAIVPVLLYNGKKGKDAKYLFYIFYPAHLLVLTLFKILI